jgi:hypothetical protein
MWIRGRQMPTAVQRWPKRRRQLFVVGPGLLQAHHIRRGVRQPGQQAEIGLRSLLDGRADAVDVDRADGERVHVGEL